VPVLLLFFVFLLHHRAGTSATVHPAPEPHPAAAGPPFPLPTPPQDYHGPTYTQPDPSSTNLALPS
jgi:hypothetical protein